MRSQYPEIDEPTTVLAMRRLGEVWKQLFPAEQVRLVNLLIERVQLLSDGVDIVWRESGWRELAGNCVLTASAARCWSWRHCHEPLIQEADQRWQTPRAPPPAGGRRGAHHHLRSLHFKKRGVKKVIVAPEGVSQPVAVTATPVLTPEQDRPLLKALGRGIYWQQLIDNGTVTSGTEIAEREGIHRSTVNDLLRLALLAPTSSGRLRRTAAPGGVAGGHPAGQGALGLE